MPFTLLGVTRSRTTWEEAHTVRNYNEIQPSSRVEALMFVSGDVYSGQQTNSHINIEVVIKIAKRRGDAAALIKEHQILENLYDIHGIPKALWLGRKGELHVMVLECLGPSLAARFQA